MTQDPSQPDANQPTVGIDFSTRAASVAWEPVPLCDSPQHTFWAWFKPPAVPTGLLMTIPDETFHSYPQRDQLTLRKLLHSAGIQPASVAAWSLQGMTYDAQAGTNPLLDQPIPEPVAGSDPNIVIYLNAPQVAQPPIVQSLPASEPIPAQALSTDADLEQVFQHIDAEWQAVLQLEVQLRALRKQVGSMSGKLNSLNRDLSLEEKQHANRVDINDWQDARRWIRDSEASLSRCMKDHDLGDTSSAGKRHWFEQLYEQHVVPRQPFENMLQTKREFEIYHKSLQTLQNRMNSKLSEASQNGERRAQQILSSIAAKIRKARSNR